MPEDVRIWHISQDDKLVEVKRGKLNLEERIEQWTAQDIGVLAEDLLVIGRQVPTDFGGWIDLLCIDSQGSLTVVELKRDKTPREITAQALDYGSWVKELSTDRIAEIANKYLGADGPLEDAFKRRFSSEFPDVINEHHSMLIVASEIDASSERIIKYLSDSYGVRINAVTFRYFQGAEGSELLARTFLVSPAEIEQNVRIKSASKRTNLSVQQFDEIADEKGVGDLYRLLSRGLESCFGKPSTRKTAIAFKGEMSDGSTKAIISLIPEKSTPEDGVRFQAYTARMAEYCETDEAELVAALPKVREPYEYYPGAPLDLKGWAGFFKDEAEIQRFSTTINDAVGREKVLTMPL